MRTLTSFLPQCMLVFTVNLAVLGPGAAQVARGESAPRYTPAELRVHNMGTPVAGAENIDPSTIDPREAMRPMSRRSPGAAASPGTTVGKTWYDYQHNGAPGRQLAVWEDTIMVVWTEGLSNLSFDRRVTWNRVVKTGSPVSTTLDDGSSINILPLSADLDPDGIPVPQTPDGAGYVTMDIIPGTGQSVVFCHGNSSLFIRIDDAQTGTFFGAGLQPFPPTASGTPLWPKGAAGLDRNETPNLNILHVIAQSSTASLYNPIWYWRGELDLGTRFVAWDIPLQVGSVATSEGYVIAADPNSDRVAIVYGLPLNQNLTGFDAQEFNNSVYRESTNAGVDWSGEIFITGNADVDPPGAGYYPYADYDVLYDENGNLHVVYTARWWNGASWDNGNIVLVHWDRASGAEHLIDNAVWTNTCATDQYGTGVWNTLLGKPSIAFKPAGFGPGPITADELLYVAWVQFGPTQDDCSSQGRTNGEIYYSASSDGGVTWSTPVNVTGTQTPGCGKPDCLSENWVTAASRVDDGLYLSYVEDTHPHAAVQGEGLDTQSDYKVLAVATQGLVASGRLRVQPIDPPSWNDPFWSNVVLDIAEPATGEPVAAQFEVGNLGNGTLNYTATVTSDADGPAFVSVNGGASYSGSIAPLGAPEVVTVNIDPNGYDGIAEFRVEVTIDALPIARSGSVTARDTVDLLFRVPGLLIITCPISLSGDINVDGSVNSSDIIGMVNYAFKSGADPLPCVAAADVDCSGAVTSADVIYMVNYVFKSQAGPCDACTSSLASEC